MKFSEVVQRLKDSQNDTYILEGRRKGKQVLVCPSLAGRASLGKTSVTIGSGCGITCATAKGSVSQNRIGLSGGFQNKLSLVWQRRPVGKRERMKHGLWQIFPLALR